MKKTKKSKMLARRFVRELHKRSASMSGKDSVAWLQQPLEHNDPEVYSIIRNEKERQRSGLELIASENFASKAVLDAMGSCLNDKYSEGYPGLRYYGGTQNIDALERLTMKRALNVFRFENTFTVRIVQRYLYMLRFFYAKPNSV